MAPIKPTKASPSIQSFYEREVHQPEDQERKIAEPSVPGDAFTKDEKEDAIDPLSKKWNPERNYDEMGIADLVAGPKPVTFVGRIVNLATIFGRNPKQPKAAGWHRLTLKDNSAAIFVFYPFPPCS